MENYKEIARSYRVKPEFYGGHGVLPALLQQADVMLSEFSTTLAEAAIVGVVPVIVDFQARQYWQLFESDDALTVANSAEALRQILSGMLDGERISPALVARFAQHHAHLLDGQATQRVVEGWLAIMNGDFEYGGSAT